jgi:hypothetical protein
MRSDRFRLKSTERSFGLRDLRQNGECSRAALQSNIEENPLDRNRGRLFQGIWQREEAKQITASRERGKGLYSSGGRKLNEINGLRDIEM